MNQSLWPYNADSPKVDTNIAWQHVAPGVYKNMTVAHVKSIDVADLRRLVLDASYRGPFIAGAPKGVAAGVAAKLDGRKIEPEIALKPVNKKDDMRGDLHNELDRVNAAAISNDNLTAQIQIIKLRAELESMLNQKEKDNDKVVNIYVNTGIKRG